MPVVNTLPMTLSLGDQKVYKMCVMSVKRIERGSKIQNFGVYGHTRGHTHFENMCVCVCVCEIHFYPTLLKLRVRNFFVPPIFGLQVSFLCSTRWANYFEFAPSFASIFSWLCIGQTKPEPTRCGFAWSQWVQTRICKMLNGS